MHDDTKPSPLLASNKYLSSTVRICQGKLVTSIINLQLTTAPFFCKNYSIFQNEPTIFILFYSRLGRKTRRESAQHNPPSRKNRFFFLHFLRSLPISENDFLPMCRMWHSSITRKGSIDTSRFYYFQITVKGNSFYSLLLQSKVIPRGKEKETKSMKTTGL